MPFPAARHALRDVGAARRHRSRRSPCPYTQILGRSRRMVVILDNAGYLQACQAGDFPRRHGPTLRMDFNHSPL